MADAPSFNNLVPGFDFLQQLVKNAGSALPHVGQWVAPTLDPQEIEKRIGELKTVQFWLEQNARMLGATIQALEVQRMTLSTLKTMNVQMGDLRDSMTIRMPEATGAAASGAAASATAPKAAAAGAAAAPGVVDPMQWWGALTQQFTQLATAAMKEGATGAAQSFAGAMQAPAAAMSKAAAAAKKSAKPADAGLPKRASPTRP